MADKQVIKWLDKISDALKRERDYRKDGRTVVDIYEAKRSDENPFSILYANTDTLAPSVYNARPIPIVQRKYKDPDPVGKASSEVATRMLKYFLDEEALDFDTFDDLMNAAVLDGLVTNRGITRFRYHEQKTEDSDYVSECVYGEAIRWDKFFHGYARSWKKVPWIGFEHDMSEADFKREFSEFSEKVDFEGIRPQENSDGETTTGETRQELTGVKIIKVYEVWDKASRKVFYLTPAYKDEFLRTLEDPLKLKGFYPVPRPLNFMRKISTLVPTPLYNQYEKQAKELNELTIRLKYIIKAIKVRGFFDSTIQGIDKVLSAEDNTLIGVENMASMPEGMAADKMIYLVPIEKLIEVARELYAQREQCKQIIYEITGVSDILRGATRASETATAQQLKNTWGTLRLKKSQREVQRYCRDCLKIMLEIGVTNISLNTIRMMTGLPYLTQQEKEKIKQEVAFSMAQGQEADRRTVQLLQQPSWEDILSVLQNDVLRDYKVDIETNSTIDAEAAQDKQDISELLNALSQFLNGIAPLVEKGAMSMDVAKQMLLTIARRYTFGPQLEEAIQAMQPPQAQADPAAQAKAAAAQAQAQMNEQQAKIELAKMQRQEQIDQAEHARKIQMADLEAKAEMQSVAAKYAEAMIAKLKADNQAEFLREQHEQKMEMLRAKRRVKEETE